METCFAHYASGFGRVCPLISSKIPSTRIPKSGNLCMLCSERIFNFQLSFVDFWNKLKQNCVWELHP